MFICSYKPVQVFAMQSVLDC